MCDVCEDSTLTWHHHTESVASIHIRRVPRLEMSGQDQVPHTTVLLRVHRHTLGHERI
eukprot:COSAG05_NODE_1194_length_5568_cov_26.075878_3_plen_58_part_00